MKKIILSFYCSFLFAPVLFSQNVGIGITNPIKAKLEVHGAVDATSAIFGGESTGVSIQRNWPGIGFNSYAGVGHRYMSNGYGGVLSLDPVNGYMVFDMFSKGNANTNVLFSNRAMVINNLGWVNIGSAQAPTATLRVFRGNASDGTAMLEGTHYASYFNTGTNENTYIRAGKNNGTVFINDIPGGKIVLNGYVGINTTTPVYPLEIRQVNNRGLILVEPENFNNWELRSFSVGNNSLDFKFNGTIKSFIYSVDGAYFSTSDKRLKKNIQSLPSLLNKVMQLQPVQYEMIHNNPAHKKSMGFLAQEIKELFPELVRIIEDSTSGYKGITGLHTINYSGFGVIAIKGIQEQQQIINSQQQAIQKQQAEIDELKRQMSELLKQSQSNKQ